LIGHIEFTAEYLAAHLIILLSLHFFLKIFSFIMMQDSFISTKKFVSFIWILKSSLPLLSLFLQLLISTQFSDRGDSIDDFGAYFFLLGFIFGGLFYGVWRILRYHSLT